LAEAIKAIG